MREGAWHMNIRIRGHRPVAARAGLHRIAVATALAAGVASLPILAQSASAAPTAKGTVIATAPTAFGAALVVGSGKYAGYSLYYITSDHGTTFGCSSKAAKTPVGPILCTGPPNDKNAEWPAITTTGAPVAGTGVSQSLLGRVKRSFGEQVTYAGHPLYLFDTMAGAVTGEGWDEPGLPPWHGVWFLIAPSGSALPSGRDSHDHDHRRQDRPRHAHDDGRRVAQLPCLQLQQGLRRTKRLHRRLLRSRVARGAHRAELPGSRVGCRRPRSAR